MIDLTQPPPKRWIQATIGKSEKPAKLGHVMDLQRTTDPDSQLALNILADAPNHLCGDDSSNGRTHAIWALFVLGSEDETLVHLVPLSQFCQAWVKRNDPPPLPTELLFMYAFAGIRLEQTNDAKMAVLLASRRRLTTGQREDLTDLVLGLPDKTEDGAPLPN